MRWRAVQVTLEVNNSEAAARMVKARLERTALGQVAKRIRAVLAPSLTHQVPTLGSSAIASWASTVHIPLLETQQEDCRSAGAFTLEQCSSE